MLTRSRGLTIDSFASSTIQGIFPLRLVLICRASDRLEVIVYNKQVYSPFFASEEERE